MSLSSTCAASPSHRRPSPSDEEKKEMDPADAEELQRAFQPKNQLLTHDHDHSHTHASASPPTPLVRRERHNGLIGLFNQGATCYLNSLLQALYHTREVRDLVFAWQTTTAIPTTDENGQPLTQAQTQAATNAFVAHMKRSVPYQLQLLFARLTLATSRTAIDTTDLTHSFGWTNADSFRQHDVQELMRVLLTALERAWNGPASTAPQNNSDTPASTPLLTKSTSIPPPPLSSLYTGQLRDMIECQVCHAHRSHADPFQDLSLPVVGFRSLHEALKEFTKSEKMEGDNKLRCESDQCGGQKQEATKGLVLESLPAILTFQLKRFIFDFNLMQRVKVNDSFDFPQELDMAPFISPSSFTTTAAAPASTHYELFAILMHSGVAQGGHYYSYLRSLSDGCWYEFNDANVWELNGGIDGAMKNARGGDGVSKNGGSSAYMIMYRRVDPNERPSPAATTAIPSSLSASNSDANSISSDIRQLIAEEEKEYAIKAAIAERERRMLELSIHFHAYPLFKLQLDLSTPMQTLAKQLVEYYHLGDSRRLIDLRLRKYEPSLKWSSTIYPCDSELSLDEVGLVKQNQLLLELKQPEEEWAPYVADTVPLRCIFVTPANVTDLVQESLHPIETSEVFLIEVSKHFHLGELRKAIVAAATAATHRTMSAIPSPANQRILLLHEAHCEILKEELTLNHYDLYPGRYLYIEHAMEEEMIRPTFDRLKCQIELCYNLPAEPSTTNAKPVQPDYNQKIFVSRNDKLGNVKAKIGAALNLDVDTFRLARTHTAPQFKDPDETLVDLQLVNQSGIYVSRGRPLKKEEYQITFFLYQNEQQQQEELSSTLPSSESTDSFPSSTPSLSTTSSTNSVASSVASVPPATTSRFPYLFDLPLRGDLLISQLKLDLLNYLNKKRPHPTLPNGNGWNIEHMRLRIKKGGTSTAKIFEDGKTLLDNLSNFKLNVEDGLEILIQKLDEPEVWTKDQFMLQIQQWQSRTQKLGPVQDFVTRKNISVGGIKQQLYKLLHNGQAFVPPPSATAAATTESTETPASLDKFEEAKTPADAPVDSTDGVVISPIPQPIVISAPIQLAKGKLTGRMKKADMMKLAWLPRDAGDTKLLRNALSIRAGELMLFQEELTEEERLAMAAAKEKKKQLAASAAATTALPTDPATTSTSTAAPVARKPWQRAGAPTSTTASSLSRSRLRKPVGGASTTTSTIASVSRKRVEHTLHIGWETPEEEEAALREAMKASMVGLEEIKDDHEPNSTTNQTTE